MNNAKARRNESIWHGTTEYFTRKDHRKWWDNAWYLWSPGTGWRKEVKKLTARKSRRRKITDETPYKKLVDPWGFD